MYWGTKLAFTVEILGAVVFGLIAANSTGIVLLLSTIACCSFALSAFANRMQQAG